MTEGAMRMSEKERRREPVMEQVQTKAITLKKAAVKMRVCYRQAKRIKRRFRREGAAGLVHASRDRESNRKLPREFKDQVLGLYEEHYFGFGPTLAAEKMLERDGVKVHRETLRRWLIGACLRPMRTAHGGHRSRRERRARFGELVQLDGSRHLWFGDRGPMATLMVMVDDATNTRMTLMAEEETTGSAMALLWKWIETHGVPEALYVDRNTIYVADREPTEEEKRLE